MLSQVVKSIILIYQWLISPAIQLLFGPGFGCRFTPTCSDYAADAFRIHRGWKAFKLTFFRICRCHPWSEAKFDPVTQHLKQDEISKMKRNLPKKVFLKIGI